MGWLTVIWLMIAVASAAFALVHGYVWLRLRDARAHGAFMLCAAGVSMVASLELAIMHSHTPEQVGRLIWLLHFPLWVVIVGCVLFVRFQMRAGRLWLAWTAIALRSLVLAINVFSTPNVNFLRIAPVTHVPMLGDSVAVVSGTPNPLILFGVLSIVALALFIFDATVDVWQRGERRLAVAVGGLLTLFVLAAVAGSALKWLGVIIFPAVVTICCVPIVLAMGFEASRELVRAAQLSPSLQSRYAELRDSEASLQMAAEAAHVALWSVDSASGDVWTNATAAGMFGFVPGQRLRLTDFMARIHANDRQRVSEAMSFDEGKRAAYAEYRVLLPGGEERWYSSRAGVTQLAPAASSLVSGLTMDITARRRTELEAEQRRLELDRLTRVSDALEFSSAMVHELSQPLAIIMSNAEAAQSMLGQAQPDHTELLAVFRDIVAADERASAVLARLRSLPRHGDIHTEAFSINALVADVLALMQADLDTRGVVVVTRFASHLPPVDGERLLIEQVLFNLVRNACDAMANNVQDDRSLSIVTAIANGMAEVRVADVGSGLPDKPEQIFQPFFTTKSEGLGVGLAICRSIVEAHRGKISAAPNGARGACLRIRLPFARAPEARAGATS